MEIDITQVIVAIIALVSAALTAFVLPWLKAKIGQEKFNSVWTWVKVAVKAAEQIYATAEKQGIVKKEYVEEFLKKNKIKYDEAQLNAMIEAAVLDLKVAAEKDVYEIVEATER